MPYKSDKIKLKPEQDRRRKLTDEQKDEIRKIYESGVCGTRPLAEQFGVSRSTIQIIVNPKRAESVKERIRKHWKDYRPTKEEWAAIMREHRKYKHELYKKRNYRRRVTKMTSREDFLTTLLNCGVADLCLIDNVGYDWGDILRLDVGLNFVYNINNIMQRVFFYGYNCIQNSINDKIENSENRTEIKELQKLNPYNDFTSYHNFLDTSVYCMQYGNIYKKYLLEELDEFQNGTGCEIQF